jgi:hypothetical protein
MKTRKILVILVVTLGLMVCQTKVSEAAPMSTAFTYQGHLYDANHVANGNYDFQFKLYDSNSDGNQVGSDVDKPDVNVVDGYFTVELDFNDPNAFNGEARWLKIGVRPGASTGGYTTLSPRQEITATPYAMYASNSNVKQLIADFVVAAGESVTAGDVVGFLDGYVQKGFGIAYSTEYVFNSADTDDISAAALSSTKFVVAYYDAGNSDYGTAVIGDVSGNTITYGSEYVFNSAASSDISVAPLSETKFAVGYRDIGNSDYGTAVIGDVSDSNIITYGSEYVFNSAFSWRISVAALSSTKFVVAYQDNGNSDYGTAVIGAVSGNTITYGSEYVFNSADTDEISAADLSSTKFVVAYLDNGNSYYGTAVIGDVSGNTITYGSEYVFNSAPSYFNSAAALSSTRFVVAYQDNGNSDYGTAVIGDVSDSNIITYGSEYVFNSAATGSISAAARSDTQFVVAYYDAGNSAYGTVVIGDVSINYGSEYVFNSAWSVYNSVAALSSTKFVVAYGDNGNSDYGTAVIGNVYSEDVVGIARQSRTAGQTVPVIIGGVSDLHSNLSVGAVYYVDASGALTMTKTDWPVGLAISPTELLLDIER